MYNGTLDIYLQQISSAHNGNSAIFWVICGVYSHCCIRYYIIYFVHGRDDRRLINLAARNAHNSTGGVRKGIMLAESIYIYI